MQFSDDMIGKWVQEISTGDVGKITREKVSGYHPGVYVQWETGNSAGEELHITLDGIRFIESKDNEPEEITINGKRYKLTLIKD